LDIDKRDIITDMQMYASDFKINLNKVLIIIASMQYLVIGFLTEE
tara:strand:- start:170 stop:304 length:135 start_codon:yes stop_codon:yes gene_type:complete